MVVFHGVRATLIGLGVGGLVHQTVLTVGGGSSENLGTLAAVLGGAAAVISAITGLVVALRRKDPNELIAEAMLDQMRRDRALADTVDPAEPPDPPQRHKGRSR